MIARIADGLPLAASVQDDEGVSFQLFLFYIWNLTFLYNLYSDRSKHSGVSEPG